MTKKTFYLISCNFLAGICIIFVFFSYSRHNAITKNAFYRFFPPHVTSEFKSLDIKYNTYYFAGFTSQHIYLSNFIGTSHVIAASFNLDTQHLQLKYPLDYTLVWGAINVKIDSPYIYAVDNKTKIVVIGKLPSMLMTDTIRVDNLNFDIWSPISAGSFIFRVYDNPKKQNILVKRTKNNPHLIRASNLLQKQLDGMFCTDGYLHYDSYNSYVIYQYAYRNQFLCIDTNMNLIYRSKTIDTTSRAKIELDSIFSEHRVTFRSPPLLVNRRTCVANGRLFVNSTLKADNEDGAIFNKNAAIDVYDIKDSRYLYSFYIPDFNGERMKHFQVINKTLIVLYEHTLAKYRLNI